MKKIFTIKLTIILLIFSFSLTSVNVKADYNYSPWLEPIESTISMSVSKIIDNVNIEDELGNKPNVVLDDLKSTYVHNDLIYITDAKQGKILVFNSEFKYIKSYPSVDSGITLKEPNGVFINDDLLYIADTENYRVVVLDLNTSELVKEIKDPADETFTNIKFRPERIVVDRSNRLLVVARDIYEGIMEFDADGNFARYYGTNTVTMNFLEALIYKFSTKKQKEKMALKLQASFTSLDIDEYGYIYTISRTETSNPVKKLNFKGKDIMHKNGYVNVMGDYKYEDQSDLTKFGPSTLIDISVNEDNNRFSVLDSKRGRIFTYDIEGHLLYVSGTSGSQKDMLQNPTSVSYLGEKLIVTDSESKSILIYEPTRIGKLINDATKAYYDMDYDLAKDYWQQVIKENSNYFLAYAGIGKANLRNEEWEEAITNLKLGHDYYNYSKAYQQYRNIKLKKYLPYVFTVVILLTGYSLYKSISSSVKRGED